MATVAVDVTPQPIAPVEPEIKLGPTEKLRNQLRIDPEQLKKRYLAERDKRLRKDGNQQYREVKGQFQHYLYDPYVPRIEREPMDIETDFLVVGGGYGGLSIAASLVQNGITNIKIMDKSGDFGGTWYWNRYPGAACDIEAYVYMPLLDETNYVPTEKYAKAPELLEHAARIGRHYDLYSKAIFQTEANKMTWDDAASRWIVETDRGDKIRARFFASASGPLNMPKLPGVEGIETYKGHSFHTSRWDYDYTGGTLHGNLDKIKDKKIGIIGTGATAVQAVPHLGEGAGELYVFQRTPSSISVRANRATDPEWAESLKPGWQRHRQENFLRVMGGADEEDLVADGWTTFARFMRENNIKRTADMWGEFAGLFELADHNNMERIRQRCEDVVRDKATANALKPWYRQFCKRPCFHDEYLDTFNRPNVTLVDTDGQGIERITEKGIVANGKEYELDCIIYSTGFEVGTSYSRRSNFEIYGRNGLSSSEKWKEGARTLHGFFARDFPNMFIITTAQSGFAANFVHMLMRQGEHIGYIIKTCKERNIKVIETTQEAEDAWTDIIVQGGRMNASYQLECTPGYYNLEGQITSSLATKRSASYAAGPLAFCKVMDDWREEGSMKGLETTVDEKAWVS